MFWIVSCKSQMKILFWFILTGKSMFICQIALHCQTTAIIMFWIMHTGAPLIDKSQGESVSAKGISFANIFTDDK